MDIFGNTILLFISVATFLASAANFFVLRFHSHDDMAHTKQFKVLEDRMNAVECVIKDKIDSHSRDSDAHQRATQRIAELETVNSFIRINLDEIKKLLHTLIGSN